MFGLFCLYLVINVDVHWRRKLSGYAGDDTVSVVGSFFFLEQSLPMKNLNFRSWVLLNAMTVFLFRSMRNHHEVSLCLSFQNALVLPKAGPFLNIFPLGEAWNAVFFSSSIDGGFMIARQFVWRVTELTESFYFGLIIVIISGYYVLFLFLRLVTRVFWLGRRILRIGHAKIT